MEMNELSKQDKATIEAIVKAQLEHYNLIQPTAKDEVRYVEDVKERWLPSYGSKYWYIGINDGLFFVSDFHWGNDDVDFTNRETGNCFKTKEIAKSAATKIKALLQTI